MFSNPFTPDSQKAKKSLFNQGVRAINIGRKLSEQREKSLAQLERVKYGDFKVLAPQVEFLHDLEKQISRDFRTHQISVEDAAEMLNKLMHKKDIEMDKAGNIIVLNISQLQLNALPNSIDKLVKLRKLNFSFNRIIYLTDKVCDLPELQILVASSNKLGHLPERIGNLKNLKILICNINELEELPDSINQLENLTQLYCQTNKITTIIEQIKNLSKLESLNCNNNPINSYEQRMVKQIFSFAEFN